MTCPACDGTGRIEYREGLRSMSSECSMCKGTGNIYPTACRVCDAPLAGSGDDVCDDCWDELEDQAHLIAGEELGRDE